MEEYSAVSNGKKEIGLRASDLNDLDDQLQTILDAEIGSDYASSDVYELDNTEMLQMLPPVKNNLSPRDQLKILSEKLEEIQKKSQDISVEILNLKLEIKNVIALL